MNYVVLSRVETEKALPGATFSATMEYLWDPPLETEADDEDSLRKLVEMEVAVALFPNRVKDPDGL